MYVISNAPRIYIFIVFFLCPALFSSSTLAADGYWSTTERRVISSSEVSSRVNNIVSQNAYKPSGTNIRPSVAPSVSTSVNSLGGLSTKTSSIISTLGGSSPMTTTAGYSASTVKTAALGCLTNKACATRLGTAGILAAGIQGWMDVYDYFIEDGVVTELSLIPVTETYPNSDEYRLYGSSRVPSQYPSIDSACSAHASAVSQEVSHINSNTCYTRPQGGGGATGWLISVSNSAKPCAPDTILGPDGICRDNKYENAPVPLSDLSNNIDTYTPNVSDMSLLGGDLASQKPDEIVLEDLQPIASSEQTKTVKNAQGDVTGSEVTTNELVFNVQNNSTANPAISVTNNSTTVTYDQSGNVTGSETSSSVTLPSTTPEPVTFPEFELPAFCSWASIVCDWIGWTQESIEGDEPDLINLISEFEPDENEYVSSIGAGSCPAPMSLNLGIINRIVEVSYQPICDFLAMIRPLVIAGAWLLSAFMYVGVLRRG